MIAAPGYASIHVYRSQFPRSSNLVNLRSERIADADKNEPAIVTLTWPRGHFDPARDKMAFDSQSPPPGAVPGAGVSSSKIMPTGALARPVVAEFNGERITGRTWPAANHPNQVVVMKLTY